MTDDTFRDVGATVVVEGGLILDVELYAHQVPEGCLVTTGGDRALDGAVVAPGAEVVTDESTCPPGCITLDPDPCLPDAHDL